MGSALWRQAQALVDAASGRHAKAEQLVASFRFFSARTGSTARRTRTSPSPRCSPPPYGEDEAAAALEQALERYDRKRNVAMVAQVQPGFEQLRAEALKA